MESNGENEAKKRVRVGVRRTANPEFINVGKDIMDFSNCKEIDGLEALNRLSKGETIFTLEGDGYYIDPETKAFRKITYVRIDVLIHTDINDTDTLLSNILRSRWFVMTPFDVRKAMRERPNEYVGAYPFKDRWQMVGLDEGEMVAKESVYVKNHAEERPSASMERPTYDNLDVCIPIEWVPFVLGR